MGPDAGRYCGQIAAKGFLRGNLLLQQFGLVRLLRHGCYGHRLFVVEASEASCDHPRETLDQHPTSILDPKP